MSALAIFWAQLRGLSPEYLLTAYGALGAFAAVILGTSGRRWYRWKRKAPLREKFAALIPQLPDDQVSILSTLVAGPRAIPVTPSLMNLLGTGIIEEVGKIGMVEWVYRIKPEARAPVTKRLNLRDP